MASEIRVNTINNRSGFGTISITDSGAVFSGVTTSSGGFSGNITGNVTGDVNAGVVTATSSIVVGDKFINSSGVGIGTTDTAGRNAGVGTAVGTMIYNTTTEKMEVYHGADGWGSTDGVPYSATGGTVTTDGLYTIHTFTIPQTGTDFALTGKGIDIDFLLVGGGGGGGGGCPGSTGGGGAGSVIYKTGIPITIGSYTVTIGAGAPSSPTSPTPISPGGSSTFNGYTAAGGGHGHADNYTSTPVAGSGGGGNGSTNNLTGGVTSGSTGHPGGIDVVSPDTGWVNPGGDGTPYPAPPSFYLSGGGGGAGSAGGSADKSILAAGAGGDGARYTISGSTVYYGAGGGGASGWEPANPVGNYGQLGGQGGGGTGGRAPSNTPTSGLDATGYGSGGGGGGYQPGSCGSGGAGSAGICIIKYLTSA
jgi:hypothetical protein